MINLLTVDDLITERNNNNVKIQAINELLQIHDDIKRQEAIIVAANLCLDELNKKLNDLQTSTNIYV